MRWLAGPLLIALAMLLLVELSRSGDAQARSTALQQKQGCFSAGVVTSAFALEWYGVRSGVIFGNYTYGSVLQPQIDGVPLAIGFAWLIMIWSSAALAQRLLPVHRRSQGWIAISLIALLMVAFDRVMEPAAMKLFYWNWAGDKVPPQNYLAWLVISLLYATAGWHLRLFQERLPRFAIHLYGAQMLYFFLILW